MSYDSNCDNCPYIDQNHLNTENRTSRESPPIKLENNNSDTLLVFQAPGIEEWRIGQAIQPVKKKGGTAGSRIELSWKRRQKNRNDFDIINTVQCFPGSHRNRDTEPNMMSISFCSNRLEHVLNENNYKRVITFGKIAQSAVEDLINKLESKIDLVRSKHPTGGLANQDLDNLW